MAEDTEARQAIQAHRAKIDEIDHQIVALLNQRATEALAIRALKPSVHMGLFDPKREEEIYEGLEAINEGPMYNDDLRAIYSTILKVSKELRA